MAGTKAPNKARYGHIATLIMAYVKRENIPQTELAARLGGSPSLVNAWSTARGAPSVQYRPKLAALLGVPEADLMARTKSPPAKLGPARQAVALAKAQDIAIATPQEPVRDVFSIVGRSDGQISVRLQATLPGPQGMALGRYLMDFGLIIGNQGDDDG